MTKDEALRLALEALEYPGPSWIEARQPAITVIKAALEAKDEKANDELRRLHDLLGKANALARIRANKIDELEQRLTKTEAQLGEAVWNYGELKREQLANQQKTSGSPINTSTALEAKDEPVAWQYRDANDDGTWTTWTGCDKQLTESDWRKVRPLYTTPQPQRTWVGLTDKELAEFSDMKIGSYDLCLEVEAKLKEKNT